MSTSIRILPLVNDAYALANASSVGSTSFEYDEEMVLRTVPSLIAKDPISYQKLAQIFHETHPLGEAIASEILENYHWQNSFLERDTAHIFSYIKRENEALENEISEGLQVKGRINDFVHAFLLRQKDTLENTNNLKKVFLVEIEAFFQRQIAKIPTLEEARLLESLKEHRDLIRSYAVSTEIIPSDDLFYQKYAPDARKDVACAERILSKLEGEEGPEWSQKMRRFVAQILADFKRIEGDH